MPASKTAAADLSVILGKPPEVRHGWLVDQTPEDYRQLILAAKAQMGTPYGLYEDDPIGFVTFVLGESLWSKQREILTSLVGHPRTAVPSCHNAGKSWLAARAVAWFVSVHPPETAKVITTADKGRRVRQEFWPQIRAVHARAGLPGECLSVEWRTGVSGYRAAYGYSPEDTDDAAFSGIHAPYVLAVVDEAGAFSTTLGQSIEALMSGLHARLLAIGNPSFGPDSTPWFEERCEQPSWQTIRIAAKSTPNFTGERTPACKVHPEMAEHPISEHLISRQWVADTEAGYGPDDAYVVARIHALFPRNTTDTVIPRSLLDDAVPSDPSDPDPVPAPDERMRLGVDVAADGGDEFVIARAEGYTVRVVHATRGAANAEPHDVAGRVLEQILEAEAEQRRRGWTGRVRVKVDSIGVGWGVTGILKAWGSEGQHHADIVAVNVAEACDSPDRRKLYPRKRAEMWHMGRTLCQPRVMEGDDPDAPTGPPTWRLEVTDEATLRQLSTPRKKYTSDGRQDVESKKDMRARGVPSPDRAEAILLAVYEPRPAGRARLGVYPGQLPRPGLN